MEKIINNENYKIGNYIYDPKRIGKGNFSVIYKGTNILTNKIVAIKKIEVDNINKLKKNVRREIELHTKLDHPNIVKLYDVILDRDNHIIYLIMEYCTSDFTNFQKRRPIKETYIHKYMTQFRDGLQYLAQHNIFHRDLKPQNILVKNDVIKISDFGLAKEIQKDTANLLKQTYCGSPLYMAPEMMNYRKYDNRSDLWSIGIILYEMITGQPPFHVKNFKQLKDIISKDIILPDKYSNIISKQLKCLLDRLLQQTPTNRMTWDEFFNHSWFNLDISLYNENRLLNFSITGSLPTLKYENYTGSINNTTSISNLNTNNLNTNNLNTNDNINQNDNIKKNIINTPNNNDDLGSFDFNDLYENSDDYQSAHSSINCDNTSNNGDDIEDYEDTNHSNAIKIQNNNDTQQNSNVRLMYGCGIDNSFDLKREISQAINTPAKPIKHLGYHKNNRNNRKHNDEFNFVLVSSSYKSTNTLDNSNLSISPKKSSFKNIFMNSINILRDSYDYLNSHNKSI